jgi:hypothetical protein
MKLTICVDNMPMQIDSTDPELLGKWMLEVFARAAAHGITNATYITVQAGLDSGLTDHRPRLPGQVAA